MRVKWKMKGLGSQGDVRRSLNPLEEGRVLSFKCSEKGVVGERGWGADSSFPSFEAVVKFQVAKHVQGCNVSSKCAPIHIIPVLMMLLVFFPPRGWVCSETVSFWNREVVPWRQSKVLWKEWGRKRTSRTLIFSTLEVSVLTLLCFPQAIQAAHDAVAQEGQCRVNTS